MTPAYERAPTKLITKNTEVLCLSTNQRQCMLQMSDNTLEQVEEIHVTSAKVIPVPRELYRYFITKRELSNTAKLSVFKSVIVPILTYGPESWVITKRILSQEQAAERWDFL